YQVLDHATYRIFSEDDNGPCAIKLCVLYYINKQLAGDFVSNKNDYMEATKRDLEGADSYQTLMTRGAVFLAGLRKVNSESQNRHDTKFYDLENDQKDEIIQDLVDEKINIAGVPSSTFFNLLR